MTAPADEPGPSRRLRRLHSLSGVLPVGAFLVFHLGANFSATRGGAAYNEVARRLQGAPLVAALEIFVIAVPIAFHGIVGLYLMSAPRPALPRNPFLGSGAARLQRATGVVVFAFLLFHYWTTRLVQLRDHQSLNLFNQVQAAVANPWIFAFYIAGILSATFHLSNGLWSFAVDWGITDSPAAQRRMAFLSAAVFLALSVIGVRSIAAFRI
jgi:succinate dehydrogenase / fumarate reductase cytochrome b subunit